MDLVLLALFAASLPVLLILRAHLRLKQLRKSVDESWLMLASRLRERYELISKLLSAIDHTSRSQQASPRRLAQSIEQTRGQASEYMRVLHSAGGPLVTGIAPLLEADGRLHRDLGQLCDSLDRGDIANEAQFYSLRQQIGASETQVAFTRLTYNDAAMYYNLAQRGKLGQRMAIMGGHAPVDLYRIDAASP